MNYVKSSISITGTFLFYILGGFDNALKYLLISMFIDYLTGILKSFKNKNLNSEVGREGIARKVYLLCLVALGVLLDGIFGKTGVIRNLVIYYIIANEGLSILENGSEMNFPIPEFLKDSLEQLKNKKD